MPGQLTRQMTAERWAGRITTQLGKSVEAIIEVGRLLVQAKAALDHGEWGRMFADRLVPFNQRSAERLMAIARNKQLSNSTNLSNLPPAVDTLYELSRVEPNQLKAAFKDGKITPAMSRKEVTALLPPAPTPRARKRAQPSLPDILVPASEPVEDEDDEPFDPDRAILHVVHLIRMTLASWPETVSLDTFIRNLRFELSCLEDTQGRRAS